MKTTSINSFWAMSHMPYHEFRMRHIIMMCALLWLGSQTFGFELAGFSDNQNFLLNFAWYLCLATLIFCCPMIYRFVIDHFFPNSLHSSERFIECIADETIQEQVADYYAEYGKLPPNRIQNSALAILFCIWLFEVFFVLAWVKGVGMSVERTLIWQPEWVRDIAAWIKNNTDIRPFSPNDHGAFLFSSFYADYSAQELFQKPLADAAFVLHFFRLCFLLPIGICLVAVLWKTLFSMGAGHLEYKQKKGGIGSKIWAGLAMFVTLFGAFTFLLMYSLDISQSSLALLDFPHETSTNFWIVSMIWSIFAWGHAFIGLKLLYNFLIAIYQFFVNVIHYFIRS